MLLGNRNGPQVTFAVRFHGGRKEFAILEGNDPSIHARAFANQQREAKVNGWAEISRVTTEIIEKKR